MEVTFSVGSVLNGGGIGTTAYNTILQTCRKGNLRKVICWDYKPSEIDSSKIKRFKFVYSLLRYPLRAIQKYIFPTFDSGRYTNEIYDFLASKNIVECDIFHSTTTHCNKSLDVAKKRGTICVVSHWSSHPNTQIKLIEEEYRRMGKKYFFNSKKSREQMIEELSKADYVLVPSDFSYNSFVENGFPKKKLVKIPFGVDLKKYSPVKDKKDSKFRAIFVGQVTIRKGVKYLLEAWEELKLENAELIFVGNICDDASELIKKYSKNETIKFVGFDDPKKYYKQSDVFVFPSIEEGSALVTYEAMASGLPIIVTENTGSVSRDGKEGFIIPIRNVEKIKEKIKYFYDNPKQAITMGKNARKYIENFSWEKYSEEIFKFYKNISLKKK